MRLERYRRSLLALAAGGVVGGAVVGSLWWPASLLAGACLLAAVRLPWARIACAAASLVLLVAVVRPIEQALQPPSYVTVLLVTVLCLVCAVPRPQRELDAALVGAAGVVVIDASAAIGAGPALALVPCTVLVVAVLWYRQRAVADREPPVTQAFPPRRLVAVALVAVALAMLAAPAPASTGLRASLFHHRGTGSAGDRPVDRTSLGGATLDLDLRGPLGDQPVLDVTAGAPALWRGQVFQTYDGRRWHVPSGSPAAPSVAAGRDVPYGPDPLDPVPPGPAVHVAALRLGPAYDGTLVAPGVVTAVTATTPLSRTRPGSARFDDPYAGGAYAASVVLPVTDPAALDAAHGADPAGWTELPAELPQRVRTLAAAVTGTASTRPGKVAAVAGYLREHERYTLDAPVPPSGHDAVEDFLFGSHEGFCEQFASAEVVLLRSVGIPAGLATGYAYGEVGSGGRVFSQRDAHAWVEVAYPGLGWSPSDPTAGAQIVPGRRSLAGRLRSWVSSLGTTPYKRAATAGALALTLLALVGALAGLGRLRRRRRPPLGPVSAAFARLERRRPRDGAATPREWVTSLADPGLLDALTTWEAELFGADPPDEARVRGALDTLTRLRRAGRREPPASRAGSGRRTDRPAVLRR